MNKEPKEVDWSKQKPGTIGVTRRGNHYEFIAAKTKSVFWNAVVGFSARENDGRMWVRDQGNDSDSDILLPWESCIAEGHNPNGLTNAQVGDGWRLVASLSEKPSSDAQVWCNSNPEEKANPRWGNRIAGGGGYCDSFTYRVPITKPKRKAPCGPEHFPPGTVVHSGNPLYHSPVGVYSGGIRCPDVGLPYQWETFVDNDYSKWRRSIDGGKTWLPCYVETEE